MMLITITTVDCIRQQHVPSPQRMIIKPTTTNIFTFLRTLYPLNPGLRSTTTRRPKKLSRPTQTC